MVAKSVSNSRERFRSVYTVPKMDCPSEENLIRMALSTVPVKSFEFDLVNRQVTIEHEGVAGEISKRLEQLKLGSSLTSSELIGTDVEQGARKETTFSIPKMDCPSEENLIRMALSNEPAHSLRFDLSKRLLVVSHTGEPERLLECLSPLNFDASIIASKAVENTPAVSTPGPDDAGEAKTLRLLLVINGAMFVIEMVLGLMAQSAGLVADSLDMFADAAVYGLALYAVGRAVHLKVRAAHIAGWLQMVLAIGALLEVIRRFTFGSEPESGLMMGIGFLALVANVSCLLLISKKRDLGAHMKASYIFSANDVLANVGVIAAGILVKLTNSAYPDLIIGTVIALIVMRGAQRILKLS